LKEGIVLFAHGSRDPEWARPFERISQQLARKLPQAIVCTAYLEAMRPSFDEAVAALAAQGVQTIHVVPLFLGQGGHVKQDLPQLVERAAAARPALSIRMHAPIGEQPEVIAAIASAIATGIRS
jgi:sirohydrochlorin cobaltochelatase